MNKIDEIIDVIIDLTKLDQLKWITKKSLFDSEVRKRLTTTFEELKVDVDIEFKDGMCHVSNIFILHYKEFDNGYKVFTNQKIGILQNILFQKFKHTIVVDRTESVLENILGKIGKESRRDSKISTLLNKVDEEKDKNIFKRLFG